MFCSSLKEGEDQKEIKIEPADAVEEVEPLPEDYYTRPINLTEGNTLIFCPFCHSFYNMDSVWKLVSGFLVVQGFSMLGLKWCGKQTSLLLFHFFHCL